MQPVKMTHLPAQQRVAFELERNAHRDPRNIHATALVHRPVHAFDEDTHRARMHRTDRAVEGAPRDLAVGLVPAFEQPGLLVNAPAAMDIDSRTHRLDRLHKNSLADGTRQKSVNDQNSFSVILAHTERHGKRPTCARPSLKTLPGAPRSLPMTPFAVFSRSIPLHCQFWIVRKLCRA